MWDYWISNVLNIFRPFLLDSDWTVLLDLQIARSANLGVYMQGEVFKSKDKCIQEYSTVVSIVLF